MKIHCWRKVGKTESPCKAAWEIFFFHLSDPSTSFLPSSRGHFSFFKSYLITYLIPLRSASMDAACAAGNEAVTCVARRPLH